MGKIDRLEVRPEDHQSTTNHRKSPEMDELDLVLYQDTREFRCDRVVFENESSEDGSKSMDSARKSMKIKDFCSSLRYSLDVFGTSEILC